MNGTGKQLLDSLPAWVVVRLMSQWVDTHDGRLTEAAFRNSWDTGELDQVYWAVIDSRRSSK